MLLTRNVLIFTMVLFGLYIPANHLSLTLSPIQLPMLQWENHIPLIPATIWIYCSYVLETFCCGCFLHDKEQRHKFGATLIAYVALCALIYILFPTVYPRDNYPFHPDALSWTNYLFNWVREIDTPASCFPSTHVGLAVICAQTWMYRDKLKFIVFTIWGILITLSTFTTKQHYFVDALGALIVALAVIWAVNRGYEMLYGKLNEIVST